MPAILMWDRVRVATQKYWWKLLPKERQRNIKWNLYMLTFAVDYKIKR